MSRTKDICLDTEFLVVGFRKGQYICALNHPFNGNSLETPNLLLPKPVSDFEQFYVYGCDGLLFLDDWGSNLPSTSSIYGDSGTSGTYGKSVIWNPLFDGEDGDVSFRVLPATSLKPHPDSDLSSFICAGFGFDRVSKDYKVIRFLLNSYFKVDYDPERVDRVNYEVELYSFKSNTWKTIPYVKQARPSYRDIVYINGDQFWIAYENDEVERSFLLSFNFTTEDFTSWPFPQHFLGTEEEEQDFEILNYFGLLVAVIYPRNATNKQFFVWLWNSCEEWVKILTTESIPGAFRPLGFTRNTFGVQMFLEGSDHQLLLYSFTNKKFWVFDIRDDVPHSLQLFPYHMNHTCLDSWSVESLGEKSKRRKGIQSLSAGCWFDVETKEV